MPPADRASGRNAARGRNPARSVAARSAAGSTIRPDARLRWAEDRLLACRKIALRYFGKNVRVERKADRSPVTIADRKIEEFLRREIGRAYPGESMVGEEFGASKHMGATYWTIDPIDGTRAFSRGLPSWGMLLGMVERGKPAFAACDFPAVDAFLGVSPSTPAYERIGSQRRKLPKAPKPPALEDAVVFHGGSSWWLATGYATGFTRIVESCYLERAYGDCYAFLWVFRGKADLMLDYGVKIWDVAPFAALAKATGRVMTDCHGCPNFTGPESILGHQAIVDDAVRLIQGR